MPAFDHGLCGMGAGPRARPPRRPLSSLKKRKEPARSLHAIPGITNLARRSPLRISPERKPLGRRIGWNFLGAMDHSTHPAALEGSRPLSGRAGAGLDPCAVLRTIVELRPGEQKDVVLLLGQAADRHAALTLVERYRKADIDVLLPDIHGQWEDNLGAVQVRTPDRAMDLMLNRWLLYQTLACRLWARAAFYQAGGAYGFRDQLQDVMALLVSRRDLAREQILRAAGRQFAEGDVQHWWHPPTGRGVRTHISDDLLWLPYVVNQYIEVTGDVSILDEDVPFLEGQAVPPGQDDAYFHPGTSKETASLFEHCARALDRSLAVGAHGLPLMGTGDWNDGMNRVGHEGKGESIWLAWFLHTTLFEFSKRADVRGETGRAEKWRIHVSELKAAVERHGWDGEWYRRAYFDDGTPLGSALIRNVRLIRSRSPGRSCPERLILPVSPAPWRLWIISSFINKTVSRFFLLLRSTRPFLIPATFRGICRGCVKMAGNTLTPPYGLCLLSRL